MKYYLPLSLLFLSLSLLADTEVARVGFEAEEGYTVGKINGQQTWEAKDGRHVADATADVVEDSAKAKTGNRYYSQRSIDKGGPFMNYSFDIPGGFTGLYVVIEGDFRHVEGKSNWIIPKCADGKEIATLNANNGNLTLYCYNLASNKGEGFYVGSVLGEYCHYRLECDPAKKTINSFTMNDIVMTNTASRILAYNHYTQVKNPTPNSIDFQMDVDVDNIVITTIPGSVEDPKLSVAQTSVNLGLKDKSGTISLLNEGGGSFDFTATAEGSPEWLALNPASGTCSSAQNITVNLDRAKMTNSYYRAIVTIDGGKAGKKDVIICAASGTVLMYEDFEAPFMQPGEITGQGKWKGKGTDGYAPEYNEMLVEETSGAFGNACAHVKRSDGWDGYTCEINSDDEALVRVSLKLYWGSNGDEDSLTLRQNYWDTCASLWFWRNEGRIYLYKLNDGEGYALLGGENAPLDEWIDISFTLDFRSYKLTSMQMGEFKTNYAEGFTLRNKPNDFSEPAKNYTKFAIGCGGETTEDAAILIDNLRIEQLPRPELALPSWPAGMTFGNDLKTQTITVVNNGTKSFYYEISVLDYPENLSPAQSAGTIDFKGDVVLNLSRGTLDDNFYRSRVVMNYAATDKTNSGALTSVVTFAQGGYYYVSSFEGDTYKLGPIGGQDTWTATKRSATPAAIAMKDERQCLYFAEAAEATTPLRIPAEAQVTMGLNFMVEDSDNTCYLRFTTDVKSKKNSFSNPGVFPLFVKKAPKAAMAQIGYYSSGEEDFTTLMETEVGVWHDLSLTYDADVAVSSVTKMTLDGVTTNFYEGQVVLNPEYDGTSPDLFTVETVNDGATEQHLTGISVDNVRVHDSTIPEPAAALALLALALLLKSRR